MNENRVLSVGVYRVGKRCGVRVKVEKGRGKKVKDTRPGQEMRGQEPLAATSSTRDTQAAAGGVSAL